VATQLTSFGLDAPATAAGVSIAGSVNTGGFGGNADGSPFATVTLAWSAAAPATGTLGALKLATSTESRPITITGIAKPGAIATNPASVDLGPVCLGGSGSTNLDVYASDVADVYVTKATAPPMFASVSGDLPKTLGGNHNGDATVAVSISPPSGGSTGEVMGDLVLATDLPAPNDNYKVKVHATLLAGGVHPSPEMVPFGTARVHEPTSAKAVIVANCSGADQVVTSVAIGGRDKDSFLLVGPDPTHLTDPIPNTQSQTYSIVMIPAARGPQAAQLEIDYASGPATIVPLTGDGEVTAKNRETYYACGVGRPAPAWPVVLALGWLARRRRRV
jgi:hypothetical protein